jgi:hypothetical protein
MFEVSVNSDAVAMLCFLFSDEKDWKYGGATDGADDLVDVRLWEPDVLVDVSVLQVPRQASAWACAAYECGACEKSENSDRAHFRPNEKEISHAKVWWQTHWGFLAKGALASSFG